jgi:hypothetical protein
MRARTEWPIRLFFAFAFVVFSCVYPYKLALNNPNENVRIYATMAIVEHGTFRLDEIIERQGWVNDMAKVTDAAGVDHYYSVKGPALAYAGVPVYWAFLKIAPTFGHPVPTAASSREEKGWWMRAVTLTIRFVLVQVPCFAFLVWFERWLRPTTKDPILRLSAVAAAGLGTNYLAYSFMVVSHALDAVTTFLAFAILTSERRKPPWSRSLGLAALAGLLAGYSSLLEYQAFPLSVFLAIYAVFAYRRLRQLLAFCFGAILNALALMFYQWRCFGNPLTPGYKLADTPMFAEMHAQGFYGIVMPKWQVFDDLSTNPTFGFFGTSPFMWLGLYGALVVLVFQSRRGERGRRRTSTFFWAMMMLSLWVAMSAAVNWRGGWTVGPRLLGPAPPFFAFGAVCFLELVARRGRTWRAMARGVAGGLALASVCTIGLVGMVCTSIPEEVEVPLGGLALPLARAGFVPHHIAELLGWTTPTFWYFAAACALAAPLVAVLWPAGDRGLRIVLRGALAASVFVYAIKPAWSWEPPRPSRASGIIATFARDWEPKDRDDVAMLRAQAITRGAQDPCLWHRLAKLERSVAMFPEAERDTMRAGIPKSQCHVE